MADSMTRVDILRIIGFALLAVSFTSSFTERTRLGMITAAIALGIFGTLVVLND